MFNLIHRGASPIFQARNGLARAGSLVGISEESRKKGLPGGEPELPELPRGRPLRRLPPQGHALLAGADPPRASLLPLRALPSGALPRRCRTRSGGRRPDAGRRPGGEPGRGDRQFRRGRRGGPYPVGRVARLGGHHATHHRGGRRELGRRLAAGRPSPRRGTGSGTATPRARPAIMSRSMPRPCRSKAPAPPRPTAGWPRSRWSIARSPRTAAAGPIPRGSGHRGRPATWPAWRGRRPWANRCDGRRLRSGCSVRSAGSR